jgi:hypothetical protein
MYKLKPDTSKMISNTEHEQHPLEALDFFCEFILLDVGAW